MTPDHHDEYGEILRRALHAEAEKVVPSPDGLERIRAGVEQRRGRRFGAAWLTDRLTTSWGRPLLAAAATIIVVAVGVSAPQTIDRITAARGDGPADGDNRPAATFTESVQPGQSNLPAPATRPGQSAAPTPGVSGSPTPTAPQGPPGCLPGQDPGTTGSTATPTPGPPAPSCQPPEDEPEQPPVTDSPTPPDPTQSDPVTPPPPSPSPVADPP